MHDSAVGSSALSQVSGADHPDHMSETPHMMPASAAALAQATPADRDRYLDLLRALSIAVVVLGHWSIAMIWIEGGKLHAGSVIDAVPAARWATWVVQIMPVFFLVGGVVNARSWRRATARGASYATWVAQRGARLLRPTTVLVWCWTLLGPALLLAGVERGLIALAAGAALVPLWFLAVYLVLIALIPALLAAHDRLGLRLPAAVVVCAAGVDALHRMDVPVVGWTNYLLVWAVPTLLGFCWADGLLERRVVRSGLPAAGLTLLVAAVTWFGYPVSMVGLTEAGIQPPSVALALLSCVQTGVMLAAQAPVSRWLRRPRVWAAVVSLNLIAMTVYLWHLTVMVVGAGLLALSGPWWSLPPLSAAWWAARPLWLVALALCLTPVVTLLAGVEQRTPRPASRSRSAATNAATGLAVVTASGAIASLTLGGVLGPTAVANTLLLTAAALHSGAFRRNSAEAVR